MGKKKRKHSGDGALATNRKARRDYEVLETLEAGIVLRGTEIKALREHSVTLDQSFARIEQGELWLHDCTIQPYSHGNQHNHIPNTERKLLLHRREIDRLQGQVQSKGLTLIPLRLYFKGRRVKLAIGLCRGKHQHDKREDIKRRDADREARRAMVRR